MIPRTVKIFFFIQITLRLFIFENNNIKVHVIYIYEKNGKDILCINAGIFQKSVFHSVFFRILLHGFESLVIL